MTRWARWDFLPDPPEYRGYVYEPYPEDLAAFRRADQTKQSEEKPEEKPSP